MQQAHHIAKALQTGLRASSGKETSATAEQASTIEPIRQSALRRFWARMAAIYGHRWNSAFGDAPEGSDGSLTVAGDTWRRGLKGVTEPQVGIGIAACIASAEPWPPTLPEFRALCLGVPSMASARAVLHSANRDGFTRLIWAYLDAHLMRLADARGADRMFVTAYEQAREFVMRGGSLPEPSEALAPPAPVKETAAECAARLRALYGDPEADAVGTEA